MREDVPLGDFGRARLMSLQYEGDLAELWQVVAFNDVERPTTQRRA